MPNPCGPWKDSPESFSRILLYAGLAFLTLFFPAFAAAAMSLRSRDLKSRGIVTNYVRRRTLWSAGAYSRFSGCRKPQPERRASALLHAEGEFFRETKSNGAMAKAGVSTRTPKKNVPVKPGR